MTGLHQPTRTGEHRHQPDAAFPNLAGRGAGERQAAAQRLADLLDSATDDNHAADAKVDTERAQMLLDLLLRPCQCGRTLASQLDLNLPGVDIGSKDVPRESASPSQTRSGSGRTAHVIDSVTDRPDPVTNSGTYLHNLWHLLHG